MSATLPTNRYSADVILSLVVGGRSISLSHVAPDFVVFAESVELPPCEAEVVVTVDGHEHRRTVFLVDGLRPGESKARVGALATQS